tara:strand:- start:512 stop:778 length:267 start_codon:yes stop_codon:yes gene_type:complete
VSDALSGKDLRRLADFVDTSSFGVRRRLPDEEIRRIAKHLAISQDELRSLLAERVDEAEDPTDELNAIESRIEKISKELDLLSRAFPE